MHGEGEEDGVRWRIELIEERLFRITAQSPTEERTTDYRTFYPTMWGLDVADKAEIENLLDAMIRELRTPPAEP